MHWSHPVRAVQVVFGIIVLGLTATAVQVYSSATINFLLFTGIWTAFVATPFLVIAPAHATSLAHRFILVAVDLVTMVFWFAGFIALAVRLPPGGECQFRACSCLQAATVFGALEWALFTVTFAMALVGILRPGKPVQPV